MTRVTVVIPNWNGLKWLGPCLEALRQQDFQDFKTIVVDNGSQDGSVAFLRETFPEVEVCALPENLGFAAGMNAGFRLAGESPYVAALNNDTLPDPAWLSALVTVLDQTPQAGSAASVMYQMKAPEIIDTAGDGYRWSGLSFKLGDGLHRSLVPTAPYPVFGACAGACLYRRRMLDEVGGFDETYFAYMEDVDLALRAQLAGWICIAVPGSSVRHFGSASSGGGPSAFSVRLTTRNLLVTIVKNVPGAVLPLMLIWSLAVQIAAVLASLLLGRPDWLVPNRSAWLGGVWAAFQAFPVAFADRRRTRPLRRMSLRDFAGMLQASATQKVRFGGSRP